MRAVLIFAFAFGLCAFALIPQRAWACTTPFASIAGGQCRAFFTTTGAGSMTVPSDWGSTNTIEVIGGGAGGSGNSTFLSGGGGGGGAYSKSTNITLTPSATAYMSIGTGGGSNTSGGDTWFNSTNAAPTGATTGALAKGGQSTGTGTGGAGGAAASGVGGTKFNGGSGENATGAYTGGGGGGAAGLHGAGNNGGATLGAGGSGDAGSGGSGGSGGSLASVGGNGTEWDASHGSGGGGGGGYGDTTVGIKAAAAGGLYGGGGGGGGGAINLCSATAGASGKQGLVVVTYTPFVATAPTVTTNSASSFTPATANLFGTITATGGANATQSGFAYGTVSTLATVIATTTLGAQTGTASFTSAVSSLSAGTTYYFRAYATNSAGTGYGSILSFVTGNTTPSRHLRLFEGYKIKIYPKYSGSGPSIIIYQQ